MSSKYIFISKDTTIDLLKFANRLSCAFRSYAFTEWRFTILATDLGMYLNTATAGFVATTTFLKEGFIITWLLSFSAVV